MAATFNFCEDNGAITSSHGTTRSGFGADTHYATDCNHKSVDDCTANSGTAYSAAPIVAGQNGYIKYQYGKFSGTYNQILNVKYSARTAPSGALATGIHLKGMVTSTYATPVATAMGGSPIDFTSAEVAISGGSPVNMGADPSTAASSTLSSGGGYTQYFMTQLQTDGTAAAGDTATITQTLQYDES